MPGHASDQRHGAPFFVQMDRMTRWLSRDFLGGPKLVKFAWVINFQKGATALWVLALMAIYQHSSVAAWVYLGLHGTYGICWLLKDRVFPDPNWEEKITFGGAVNAVLFVLGPYWLIPWILIAGYSQGASLPFLCIAIALHTLGIAIMMTADAQKFFTLRLQRGLITSGMFRHIRHPNYLGEMMIYGSYALVVWHWFPVVLLLFVWSCVFLTNMKLKEASMSRYPEWDAYVRRTGMVLPRLFPARRLP
jgi:protein-S-isoprenylcysteine O-methyltransferase Ste14